MERVLAKPEDVYLALQSYLRTRLSLDERHCFLSVEENPPSLPLGVDEEGYYAVIATGDQHFDGLEGGLVDGGLQYQCTSDGEFTVTTVSRIWQDSVDRDERTLTAAGRGLLVQQRLVLTALTGADFPLLNGSYFLSQPVRPIRTTRPRIMVAEKPMFGDQVTQIPFGVQTLSFGLMFNVDLGV